ncbi:ATP-binding cassette domain-containing protein [Vibrio sonorensis]|uniref:ATP-binding cassette domain-containing protein n=1 Tax=Vibrio sonorensis TaxID=1004316 RepID=UPI0008DA05EB|nr:ATP-binding cassette domain-containing protein [Vibrio sonorensis]
MRLDIKNLEVSVREQILVSDINLTVEAGKTLALVGASGSGKSVTCSSIFDLLPAGLKAKGEMLLNGEPIEAKALRGKTVSCIMQNPSSAFNPLQTMQKHGLETMLASGKEYKRADLIKAMEDAGLEECDDLLDYYPFQMSGGMLQRMMIALALVTGAPFLVADEPTTDLDLVVQSHILSRIEAISKERNLGVLLVTHDFGVVARLADEVAVMSEGRIVERGDVHSIFSDPQHPVTQSLLDAHLSLYKEATNG